MASGTAPGQQCAVHCDRLPSTAQRRKLQPDRQSVVSCLQPSRVTASRSPASHLPSSASPLRPLPPPQEGAFLMWTTGRGATGYCWDKPASMLVCVCVLYGSPACVCMRGYLNLCIVYILCVLKVCKSFRQHIQQTFDSNGNQAVKSGQVKL